MSVKIKAGYADIEFTYKGEDVDLWLKAVDRVAHEDMKDRPVAFIETENGPLFLSRGMLRKIKQCVRDSQLVVAVERVLAKVSEGAWKDIDLDFGQDFKRGVRTVWNSFSALPDFHPEKQILEMLREIGGAASVEHITTELLMDPDAGYPLSFKRVREAMLRLEKLYLVEYHAGSYSYRNNILGR
jgi:hypothetical protein